MVCVVPLPYCKHGQMSSVPKRSPACHGLFTFPPRSHCILVPRSCRAGPWAASSGVPLKRTYSERGKYRFKKRFTVSHSDGEACTRHHHKIQTEANATGLSFKPGVVKIPRWSRTYVANAKVLALQNSLPPLTVWLCRREQLGSGSKPEHCPHLSIKPYRQHQRLLCRRATARGRYTLALVS